MNCVICTGAPAMPVTVDYSFGPMPYRMCIGCVLNWRSHGLSVRPDVPVGGLRVSPPPAQPFHQSAEASGTQAEAG